MHVVVLNLKLAGFDIRPWDTVKTRIFDVKNTPAIQTDKMMMLFELRVKTRCGAGMAGFGHEAKPSKRGQDTMHCHPRDLRQLNTHGAVKLLRSRMIGAAQDRFKDGASLGSHRQSALAVCREEALHPLLFFCLTHLPEMSLCTR